MLYQHLVLFFREVLYHQDRKFPVTENEKKPSMETAHDRQWPETEAQRGQGAFSRARPSRNDGQCVKSQTKHTRNGTALEALLVKTEHTGVRTFFPVLVVVRPMGKAPCLWVVYGSC